MIKKIMIMMLGVFAIGMSLSGQQAEASRIDEGKFYYNLPNMESSTTDTLNGKTPDTDIGKLITDDAVRNDDGLLTKLMVVFKLDTDEYKGPQKAFYYQLFIELCKYDCLWAFALCFLYDVDW